MEFCQQTITSADDYFQTEPQTVEELQLELRAASQVSLFSPSSPRLITLRETSPALLNILMDLPEHPDLYIALPGYTPKKPPSWKAATFFPMFSKKNDPELRNWMRQLASKKYQRTLSDTELQVILTAYDTTDQWQLSSVLAIICHLERITPETLEPYLTPALSPAVSSLLRSLLAGDYGSLHDTLQQLRQTSNPFLITSILGAEASRKITQPFGPALVAAIALIDLRTKTTSLDPWIVLEHGLLSVQMNKTTA